MNQMRKIINLKSIMGFLILVIFTCLFFSKTIYSKSIPEVTATLPYEGKIGRSNDTQESDIILPKKSVFSDGEGSYVFQIKKRKGILGDEYYLYQLRVQTGESDDENVALTNGMEYLEPVTLPYNEDFEDGMVVRVKNENDFFVSN